MREEILTTIINKTAGILRTEATSLNEATNFKSELNLKSIEIVAIIAALEEEYDVYLKYTEILHAQTLGQIADMAEAAING